MGRPLSMLSFLLQAESWPANPFNFKIINLAIHLINGGLIAALFLTTGKISPRFALPTPLIALVVFIWMVHPMQVGNVLYVVQRMNLLASFFTLLGMVGYLWSRNRFMVSGKNLFVVLMVTIPVVAALLGLLSKENGVLIYVYLAALELTILNSAKNSSELNRARIGAVFLPLMLGAIAFLFYLPTVIADYDLKSFTLLERVFTQFPVLLSYLLAILVPRSGAYSLFHDDFPIYNTLLAIPVLLSFLIIACSIAFAFRYRNKFTVIAFAILWFLFGHSLESTFLPLEMYFEHRNYLPMLGPIFAIVFSLHWAWEKWTTRRMQLGSISCLFFLWLCFVSLQQSTIWGDSLEHAYAEVFYRPDSYRAQTHLIQTVANLGDISTGFELQKEFIASGNAGLSGYVRSLEFGCLLNGIEFPSAEDLRIQAQNAQQDFSVVALLNNLVIGINSGACQQVPRTSVDIILQELTNNTLFAVSRPDLLQLRALLSAGESNYVLAAELAEESFNIRRDLRTNLLRIGWLIEAGDLNQAESVLQEFESEFSAEIANREGLAEQIRLLQESL
ncbi:MAG: hypothetical protein GKR91_19700 [Pseudomonadales bacterium]|nr:hypothetical protein [Pseudomonadales bacterium]